MIESLTTYWYLYAALVLLLVVAVMAGKKAAEAVKKKNEIMKKYDEEMKRYKFLRDKYLDLTKDNAEQAPADELCEGLTAVFQSELDKSDDPDAVYDNAPQWKREVYALYYFSEDVADSLSYFFRHNASPLPEAALQGLKATGQTKLFSLASAVHAMYDDKNESVSLDKGRIEELDEKFKSIYDADRFFTDIKNYILNNM